MLIYKLSSSKTTTFKQKHLVHHHLHIYIVNRTNKRKVSTLIITDFDEVFCNHRTQFINSAAPKLILIRIATDDEDVNTKKSTDRAPRESTERDEREHRERQERLPSTERGEISEKQFLEREVVLRERKHMT